MGRLCKPGGRRKVSGDVLPPPDRPDVPCNTSLMPEKIDFPAPSGPTGDGSKWKIVLLVLAVIVTAGTIYVGPSLIVFTLASIVIVATNLYLLMRYWPEEPEAPSGPPPPPVGYKQFKLFYP